MECLCGMFAQTIAEVAPPLDGPLPILDWQSAMWYVMATGLGAATIKKGVELIGYVWSMWPGNALGSEMSGKGKAGVSLLLAVTAPPLCFGVMADMGLVEFTYANLYAVVGVAFMSAWAWYQREKYGSK